MVDIKLFAKLYDSINHITFICDDQIINCRKCKCKLNLFQDLFMLLFESYKINAR